MSMKLFREMWPSQKVEIVFTCLILMALVGCGGSNSSSGNSNNNGGGSGGTKASNPSATMTVNPTTVVQGGTVTVAWQTQNATGITLTENNNSIALDGNPLNSTGMQFTLNTVGTTTFQITATGVPGTTPATASATVNVTAAPPQVSASLTATPTTVTVGQQVLLSWTTSNATQVTLTENGTNLHIQPGQTSMHVTMSQVGTFQFVLTATDGQGHQATAQAVVTVTTNGGGINSVNHIIFMAEENRSFDTYFGKLNEYRVANGWGGQHDVDGLPDDCSSRNSDWTVPCSASNQEPNLQTQVYAFHLRTMCIENTSADWIVSHWGFNAEDPSSDTPRMDGFVIGAASAAPPGGDREGIRAMGFYTAQDLEYHYFMASEFGTSDRWFAAAPARTEPNRFYLIAATSAGFAYPKVHPELQIQANTIFDVLQAHGISWAIYAQNFDSVSASAFGNFMQKYGPNSPNPHVFALSQFDTDVANGTLPAVVYIEKPNADEHPGLGDHIQFGVQETAHLINEVMTSSSWSSSVFILTFDEAGGLYEHVAPPTNVPNPDGIVPFDTCFDQSDPHCPTAALTHTPPPYDPTGDFVRYGFRVPVMVISPFSKPHYVSHTYTDSTSWLRFVEKRFNLSPLTQRDAVADDMTEFFDFQNVPWATPPTPPQVQTNGPCYDGLP